MDALGMNSAVRAGHPAIRTALALIFLGLVAPAHAGEVLVCKVISDCAGEAGCDPNARQYVLDPGRNTVEYDGWAYPLDYFGEEDDKTIASASPDRGNIEVEMDSDGDVIIQDDGAFEGTCRKVTR